ncbi:hypothetical protein AAG906_008366 [Vitis piasezkii]
MTTSAAPGLIPIKVTIISSFLGIFPHNTGSRSGGTECKFEGRQPLTKMKTGMDIYKNHSTCYHYQYHTFFIDGDSHVNPKVELGDKLSPDLGWSLLPHLA